MPAIIELCFNQAINNNSSIGVTVTLLTFKIKLTRPKREIKVYQFLINTYQPECFKNENLIRS